MSANVCRRLLWGLVRRNRSGLLIWLWIAPLIVRTLAAEGASVTWLMAGSMGLAFLIGLTGESVGCREHRVLPVTDRDLWLTRWLHATLLVPAYLLMLKGVGMVVAVASGKPAFFATETLLLSTVYDMVYAGAAVTLPLLLPYVAGAVGRRIDGYSLPIGSSQRTAAGALIVITVLVLVPLLFLLGMGGPLLFARHLPARLADFSTTSTLLLAAGLAMSVAALIWTPPHGGARPAQRAVPPAPATPAQPKATDRLTGVNSVIWTHVRSTFVVTGVVLVAVAAVAPFLDHADNPHNARILTGLFLTFAFMGISTSSVWVPWARRLKVLPLSVRQVNALFVLTPVVTWAVVWLMLLLAHAALGLGVNEELTPVAFVAYAGLCALTHAIGFWLMGSVPGHMVASAVGIVSAIGAAMVLFENPNAWSRLLLLLIGLLSFAVASFINHRTLTLSTSSARAYRWPGTSVRP